jgi:aspartate aminotransferase
MDGRYENLKIMVDRIHSMRQALYDELVRLKTLGKWEHIIKQIGMFSYTGLSGMLQKVFLISSILYFYCRKDNGRLSMAGFTTKNVHYIAESIDFVVCDMAANL